MEDGVAVAIVQDRTISAQLRAVVLAGTHMIDKLRHRPTRAPHGGVSNRALVLFGTCALALAFANALLA